MFTPVKKNPGRNAPGGPTDVEKAPPPLNAPPPTQKKTPPNNKRLNGSSRPYLVFHGTLAECIRELMAKPVKAISLYDIITEPQPAFDQTVLSPGDAAEIAMRKDFPKRL